MKQLSNGSVIHLKNGKTCKVKKELGRGGQGIVYLVDYGGTEHAMKWYTAPSIIGSQAFYRNLERNANSNPPAPNFLWPLAITERLDESYGYIMPLCPEGYVEMGDFMLLKTKFGSMKALVNACLQICKAFQSLHIQGLSYQDMNDGNFLINPTTGDVLICDNDNVAPDGTSTGILGKVGFMAPEIVEGKSMPNRYTDYFSLAVCLFILIYMNRPFEGAWYLSFPCSNNPEMAKELFGLSSVFIMDPKNPKNRPVKGIHDNVIRRWPLFPAILANAFCTTFSSEAITDQTRRLMDKQWYDILLQTRSMLVECPNCGKETFLDIQRPQVCCAWCGKHSGPVSVLKVGRFTIPLVMAQTIHDCQVTGSEDYKLIAGEVVRKHGELGIMNRSSYPWTVKLSDGSFRVVPCGKGLPARAGLKIRFGNQGEEACIL